MDSQKTLLFELFIGNALSGSFLFSLPPQSYQFRQPQRVNRIKTFGGAVEEDDGLDNPVITITGTTAGRRKRAVKVNRIIHYFDGYEELKAFHNEIIRYKEKEGYQNTVIKFHDLSQDDGENSWIVSFDEFTIERNKDLPLCYHYTIHLFCIERIGTAKRKPLSLTSSGMVKEAMTAIFTAKEKINSITSRGKKVTRECETITAMFQDAFSILDEMAENVESVLQLGEESVSIPSGAVSMSQNAVRGLVKTIDAAQKSALGMTSGFVSSIFEASRFPLSIAKDFLNCAKDTKTRFAALQESVSNSILNTWEDFDEVVKLWNEIIGETNKIAAYGKSPQSVSKLALENEEGEIFYMAGLSHTSVKSGETIADAAYRVYGDSAKAWILVFANKIEDMNDLGDRKLAVPLDYSTVKLRNPVYSEEHIDNYGTDIRVECGRLVIDSNRDFQLVHGKQTVNQHLNMRLSTELGSDNRKPTYGLLNVLSSPISAAAYLKTAVKAALLEDPRVGSAEKVEVQSDGVSLYYCADLTLIDDSKTRIDGGI